MEPKGLKILMISRDRNILSDGSPAKERMVEYGSLVSELHIVLLTKSSEGLKEEQIAKNVWVYPTNSSSRLLYASGAAGIGKRLVLDKKFVRGESVITAQDPYECGSAGLKVKKRWRLPLEVQIHADDPLTLYTKSFIEKVRNWLARKVIKHADSIRVVHEFLKKDLMEKFSIDDNKVFVLPIYIDREPIENGKVSFDAHARFGWQFVMFSVARLVPQKNLPFALKVLARLRQRFPNIGLVVAGAGPDKESLEAYAKSLGVEKNVAFVGWQSDLTSFYRTSNIFLQTSTYEGYGMALVEAGLSGLPVVTTPVGIALDLDDGKDAYICPFGNVDYFANAIADLIENNQKRENLKINMRKTLDEKLLTKEIFFKKIKEGWQMAAKLIN